MIDSLDTTRSTRARGAPDQRTDARHQLGHGEGLHHVVVGAEVEAVHAVVHLVARREQQHRHPLRAAAQPAQHLEAVDIGQPDVEDHEIEALARRRLDRQLAARHHVDRIALGTQDAGKALVQGSVVLDDQDAHAGA
jgi:hypothetical protein